MRILLVSNDWKLKLILPVFSWMLFLGAPVIGAASETIPLDRARTLFYVSVEQADSIDTAIRLFRKISEHDVYEGVALTYIGALTALKGKFAFLPTTKYKRVLEGLELMDQGIEKSPDNIEARFIRGMTCFYLPFFFNRKETSRKDFKNIVRNLENAAGQYDAALIMNVTDFLLEHAELNGKERDGIEQIRNRTQENAD